MNNLTDSFEFNNASEIHWAQLRLRYQQILQFDDEWTIDTPRSQAIWEETCRQIGVVREGAAHTKPSSPEAGPLGFTWWGWRLPVTVLLVDTPVDAISRVKVEVRLGVVPPGRTDELLPVLYALQSVARGGVFVISDIDTVHMLFSMALDASMVEEVVQFSVGMLHRQIAHSVFASGLLVERGLLQPEPQPHPVLGERLHPDEFVSLLFTEGVPAVPSLTGGPASPEGATLDGFASLTMPPLVAEQLRFPYREGAGTTDEIVFTREESNDPVEYFAYRIVEGAPADGYPFKNDPFLELRMQSLAGEVTVHATKLEALREANDRLWRVWSDSSRNVLGTYQTSASPAGGVYVSGPWVAWPAACLAPGQDEESSALQLAHAFMHVWDQDLAR